MKADGPVIVRSFKPTRKDASIYQVEFTQVTLRPIDDTSSLLNIMMKGHKSFGSPTQLRVAYQNMTAEAFTDVFHLGKDKSFPAEWGPRLVVHEFCEGDEIPEKLRGYHQGSDIFYPRSWVEYPLGEPVTKVQSPKMTPKVEGKDQLILTLDNKPIYRSVFFSVSGMDQADHFLKHNNIRDQISKQESSINIEQIGMALMPKL